LIAIDDKVEYRDPATADVVDRVVPAIDIGAHGKEIELPGLVLHLD